MGLLKGTSIALVFAACTAADASAVTRLTIAETKTQFTFQIPDKWSLEQRERYALPAARIKAALVAGKRVDVTNAVLTGTFNLYSQDVPGDIHIEGCTIRGKADLSYAHFKKVVHFCETTFESDADWTSAELATDLFLRSTVFARTANFTDAKVGGSIHAYPLTSTAAPATFGKTALFKGATVAGSALLPKVRFGGSADFEGVRVGGRANFSGDVFKNTVSFNGAKIDGPAFFDDGATCDTQVTFVDARIGGQASFRKAVFKGLAAFDGAWFEHAASFKGGDFQRETRFVGAHFGGQAEFTDATFKGRSLFEQVHSVGPAIFTDVHFEDANDLVDFAYSEFDGELFLVGATFAGPLHFDNARMRTLILAREGQEPGIRSTIDLRGCTYDRLEPASAWKAVLDKQEQEPYDRQPYTQLEKTLREAGEDEIANNVYYQRKCLEAKRIRFFPNPFTWAWDKFLRLASGYGVWHVRLLITFAVIVALGTVLFCWPRAVMKKAAPSLSLSASQEAPAPEGSAQRSKGSSRERKGKRDIRGALHRALAHVGKAFWVSLAAFLPVEIPGGAHWQPSREKLLWLYFTTWATLLRIAGWIFWPVAIAALTGILKR